jgi:hypothetical protein
MKEYLFFALAVAGFVADTGRPPSHTAGDRSYEETEFTPHTNSWDSARPVDALEGDAPPSQDDPVMLELSGLGKFGDTIARARGQVLEILRPGNACSAWFQEADHDPFDVFRSLHFVLRVSEPSYIYGMRDSLRGQLYKHPWGARSIENDGRNSTIVLNVKGPFFSRASLVMQQGPTGRAARASGYRLLLIASYSGNTPKAQVTILLHELGHIIGRLPEEGGDSWDGRSSRNTSEVLRHCKTRIEATAHNRSTSAD